MDHSNTRIFRFSDVDCILKHNKSCNTKSFMELHFFSYLCQLPMLSGMLKPFCISTVGRGVRRYCRRVDVCGKLKYTSQLCHNVVGLIIVVFIVSRVYTSPIFRLGLSYRKVCRVSSAVFLIESDTAPSILCRVHETSIAEL
jgi:hypothetical protein